MPYEVRMKASDVLGKIVKLFGDKYSGLIPSEPDIPDRLS